MHLINEPYEIEMSPSELLSYISEELVNSKLRLGYRGVRNGFWSLSPTLSRYIREVRSSAHLDYKKNIDFDKDIASNLYRNFKKNASINNDINTTDIDELELWQFGQHYGLPSPLLDWSHSPYVGLFFAIHDNQTSNDNMENLCAGTVKIAEGMNSKSRSPDRKLDIEESATEFEIYIDSSLDDETRESFNKKYCNDIKLGYEMKTRFLAEQLSKPKRGTPEGIEACARCLWVLNLDILKTINDLIENDARKKIGLDFGDSDLENRYPTFDEIDPKFNFSNKRIVYQQGFFTYHRNYWSFETWLRQVTNWLDIDLVDHPLVTKISFYITDQERLNLLNDLNKMNINYRTLFPDIEGSVKDAKERTTKDFMKQPFTKYSFGQTENKKQQLANKRRFKPV